MATKLFTVTLTFKSDALGEVDSVSPKEATTPADVLRSTLDVLEHGDGALYERIYEASCKEATR